MTGVDIAFAILAFLAAEPLSGYDLKKRFVESESLPWSGNNNQVYRALVDLHRAGLASVEVQNPHEGPSRKVYALTEAGRAALRARIREEPELPSYRLPVLVHLLAADLLPPAEVDAMLGAYGESLRLKRLALEELQRRARPPEGASDRRNLLWRRIAERPLALIAAEERWVRELRRELASLPGGEPA